LELDDFEKVAVGFAIVLAFVIRDNVVYHEMPFAHVAMLNI
jgi:hypothetical protein